MNFNPLEASFIQPRIDIEPMPPAPRTRPVELPNDDDGHDWYIPQDAPAEEGNALRLFEDQIAGVDFVAPPLVFEPEGNYEVLGIIYQLLDSINNVHETLKNLRHVVRDGFINNLDGVAVDVFQEARDMLATVLIDTIGTALALRGWDATYHIQVILAILMERFLDGRANDGDVEILNAIVVNINL